MYTCPKFWKRKKRELEVYRLEEPRNRTEILCCSGWVCICQFSFLWCLYFSDIFLYLNQLCLNLCILENRVVRLGLAACWNLVHSYWCLSCCVCYCPFPGAPGCQFICVRWLGKNKKSFNIKETGNRANCAEGGNPEPLEHWLVNDNCLKYCHRVGGHVEFGILSALGGCGEVRRWCCSGSSQDPQES